MISLMLLDNVTKDSKAVLNNLLSDAKDTDFLSFKNMLLDMSILESTIEKKTLSKNLDISPKQEFLTEQILNLIDINPKISSALELKDIKQLIKDAKYFIKQKIQQHPDFIKGDIKKLPKNIKSLINLAQKFNIDIRDIKLEDINPKLEVLPKDTKLFIEKVPKQTIATQHILETKIKKEISTSKQKDTNKASLSSILKIKIHNKNKQNKIDDIDSMPDIEIPKNILKKQTKLQEKIKDKEDVLVKDDTSKNIKIEQNSFNTKEHNKPQLNLNAINTLQNTQKQERIVKKNIQKDDLKPTIAGLFFDTKIEKTNNIDTDSFEVKIKEAKQMIKYLSEDVKKAIEDYKPPFSKLKVKLNPQKLGEIDVMLIQRGSNLHINLNSNNTAINILINNINELKTQLAQNGINNASFNFNSDSQQNNQNNQHKRKDAIKGYKELVDNDDTKTGFEIVVPKYI